MRFLDAYNERIVFSKLSFQQSSLSRERRGSCILYRGLPFLQRFAVKGDERSCDSAPDLGWRGLSVDELRELLC